VILKVPAGWIYFRIGSNPGIEIFEDIYEMMEFKELEKSHKKLLIRLSKLLLKGQHDVGLEVLKLICSDKIQENAQALRAGLS